MPESAEQPSPKQANREDAIAVVKRLRDAGHVAYFAGGCVRDQLLGLEPKDYDVATDAPPDKVRKLFSNTQAVGAAFGVILVRQRKSVIEVATFRTDLAYKDGRRPEGVVFTTAEEDAKRRDFTINGLFFDPIENKVIDYVGGQEDLERRVLRAIGDARQRFGEDYLRMLRAVRFAARFGLTVDTSTEAAIRQFSGWLTAISPERIAEELRLMLCPPTRIVAWPMLWQLGLADAILRFLPQGPVRFVANKSLILAMPQNETIGFGLTLAAAALDAMRMEDPDREIRTFLQARTVKTMTQAVRKSLRISNSEYDEMNQSLLGLALLLGDHPLSTSTKKRFLAGSSARPARQLMRAVSNVRLYEQRVREVENSLEQIAQTDFAPPPFVTGDDLTAAGLQPGPVFKRVLDATYDEQLEGRVTDKAAALAFALSLAKRAV